VVLKAAREMALRQLEEAQNELAQMIQLVHYQQR